MGFRDLAAIINKDPALSARILAAASSPLYLRGKRTTSVDKALAVLGTGAVKTITVSAVVNQFFSGFTPTTLRELQAFWRHCLVSAVSARLIAILTGYPSPEEAYFAGLLHHIGKLFFLHGDPFHYYQVQSEAKTGDLLLALEREEYGITHNEIGAWLIHRWGIHPILAEAIRCHHEPVELILDVPQLAKIIYLASALTAEAGERSCDPLLAAQRLFGLTQGVLADLEMEAQKEMELLASAMLISSVPDAETGDDDDFRPALLFPAVDNAFGQEVRNLALLGGVLQYVPRTGQVNAILQSIGQCLWILFGVEKFFFFLHDQVAGIVRGMNPEPADTLNPIEDFAIEVQKGRSLITEAIIANTPFHSFRTNSETEPLVVVDLQLIHLLGGDGILCLPMLSGGTVVGAIVLGIEEVELPRLTNQMKLLAAFACEAAFYIKAGLSRIEKERQMTLEQQQMYQSHAREIVHEITGYST